MNDMAKNLILWMIIAGVLLTVFNNINQETREDNINYSQFIREVRSGRVEAVELAGINITGIRSDNSRFRTVMPLIGDDQLMNDLFDNGVEIVANEPEQQSIWTQLLVASFPILIIIALFFFFMRQMQGGGAGGRGGPMSFGKSKAKLLGRRPDQSHPLPMWRVWMKPRKMCRSWLNSCVSLTNSSASADAFLVAC